MHTCSYYKCSKSKNLTIFQYATFPCNEMKPKFVPSQVFLCPYNNMPEFPKYKSLLNLGCQSVDV